MENNNSENNIFVELPKIVEDLHKQSLEQKANEEIIKVVRSSKLTIEEIKGLLTR